jgi:serine protease inhibitor
MFSDEYLVKEEYVKDIKSFFKALAQKVDTKEAAN